MHFQLEAKHAGVKRNRNIDIVNYISNADIAHGLSPLEIVPRKPLDESFLANYKRPGFLLRPDFVCTWRQTISIIS